MNNANSNTVRVYVDNSGNLCGQDIDSAGHLVETTYRKASQDEVARSAKTAEGWILVPARGLCAIDWT